MSRAWSGFRMWALLASAIGCRAAASRPGVLERPTPDAARGGETGRPEPLAASTPAQAATGSQDGGLDRLAPASNRFGLELYLSARAGRTNLALSPLSISNALIMAWAGARGETARQMAGVLHLEGTSTEVLASEASLLAWSRAPAEAGALRMANRIFADDSFVFEPAYLRETTESFGVTLDGVDFAHATEASRLRINAWVAGQTDHRIADLVPPGAVTAGTRVVLADAVYFLGTWARPFEAGSTRPAPFHTTSATETAVPTMRATEWMSFAHPDGVRLLQLPYAGEHLTMTFVLPDAVEGLVGVESRLDLAMLAEWDRALSREYVKIALPRFIVRSAPLALRPALEALGMPLAFDRAKADFTGIAKPGPSGERLFIGDVFHEAFVKVDEEGTEAAAATATVMRRSLAVRRRPEPQAFIADHPFLFLLRDATSGMILFIGRVADPTPTPD